MSSSPSLASRPVTPHSPWPADVPLCVRSASDPGVAAKTMPAALNNDAVARSRRQAHALGADAHSRWAIFSGLCRAQKNNTPYVFAEVHFARTAPPGPAVARIDGPSWALALRRHPQASFAALKEHLYARPWQRYRLCLIFPWQALPQPLMWVHDDDSYARARAYEPQLLAMGQLNPTDPRRGTLCGLFSGAAPLPQGARVPPYLLAAMNDGQRRFALNYALGRAAKRGAPALVAALLMLGVNPAPPHLAEDLLPLTQATLRGDSHIVTLLLAAGADPRQAASPLHLNAVMCARAQPHIADLFEPYPDATQQVLLPLHGRWRPVSIGP